MATKLEGGGGTNIFGREQEKLNSNSLASYCLQVT